LVVAFNPKRELSASTQLLLSALQQS
jgi:hypothetical protein